MGRKDWALAALPEKSVSSAQRLRQIEKVPALGGCLLSEGHAAEQHFLSGRDAEAMRLCGFTPSPSFLHLASFHTSVPDP